MKDALRRLTILSCLGLLLPAGLPAQQDSERELARVLAEIDALERELAAQIGRRDDGMAELREIELELAEVRVELGRLEAAIDEQSARQAGIESERREAAGMLADQQAALAEQVRLSYMTGRQELLQVLLSQEDPADFGRMLSYYDYLNRHRSERIAEVDEELSVLLTLAAESREVEAELESLFGEQETRLARLESGRAERSALVSELNSAIDASGSRIERLRAEEAELNETIARLAEIAEGFPVVTDTPIAEYRGDLPWPVEGPLVASFGDPQDESGQVPWKAILIEADTGTLVRAIYPGRVEFAQWHPSTGLLLILDHGDGVLTLYGHNAALLRERGDWVEAGESIAEVGDTGGRLGSGLYFSVRLDGEAVDPEVWLR